MLTVFQYTSAPHTLLRFEFYVKYESNKISCHKGSLFSQLPEQGTGRIAMLVETVFEVSGDTGVVLAVLLDYVPPTLWIEEAIVYLGLDRTGIKRPDKAVHRLIKKGALHPKKISGRLCFDRAELDRVLANGDHKRGRGRPRGRWGINSVLVILMPVTP